MPRKNFTPPGQVKRDAQAFAAFLAALLRGTIAPTRLYVTKNGNAPVQLEFDEP